MLHSPSTRRERILGFGPEGSGKSSAWTYIAEWIYRTKAHAKVWVIDTDLGWDAMRPEDGHLDPIVEAFPIHEWADYRPAIHKIRGQAGKDDWFVVDLADEPWEAAQKYYFEQAYGQDIDEFFLQAKINDTSVGGDYGSNWTIIKKLYNGVMGGIPSFRGHVYCATTADVVRKTEEGKKKAAWDDDAETVETYGRIGYKPNGNKRLAHMFHTVLYFAKTPSGYRVTTTKERTAPGQANRSYLAGQIVKPDFVTTYLMGVAGWKP